MIETATVRVDRVVTQPTNIVNLEQHIVYGTKVPEDVPCAFQTISSWRASICAQAAVHGFLVVIESERTAYGPTIRTVAKVEA